MSKTLEKVNTFRLVGMSHQPGAREAVMRMVDGVMLRIEREPRNKYDRRAIAVYYQGQKLGYIKADDNALISRWMDDNGHREFTAKYVSKGESITVELPL